MPPSKRIVRALLGTVGLLIAGGTGSARGDTYLPPTSPESVASNVARAYMGRDTDGYLACLAADFVFVPDPEAHGLFGDAPPTPWGKLVAARVHRRMFDGGPGVPGQPEFRRVLLTPHGTPFSDEEHGHPDWQIYRFNVEMDVWIRGRPAPFLTGHTVYFRQAGDGGGEWEIVRWEEGAEFGSEMPPECFEEVPGRQVIAQFGAGVLRLPEGLQCALLKDVTIASATVESTLMSYDVHEVAKAFPGFEPADTLAVARRTGERVRLADVSEMYKLRLPEGADRASFAAELESAEGVCYAELDGTGPPTPASTDAPNDTLYGNQWYLDHDTYSHMRALGAWQFATGTSEVAIALLDFGFTDEHEDLGGGKILEQYSDSGWWYDAQHEVSHGFRTACIASANTNNQIGMAGVDWHARLISKRVDNISGFADVYDILMDVAPHADIVNCSWGYDDYSITARRGFANAYKLNCVTVAAMGSRGQTEPRYPAAFGQGIIAVAATSLSGYHPNFSATGPHVDVAAPGVLILGCEPMWDPPYREGDGTSWSAAEVSGLAGLLLAERADLYNDDIEQIVRLTADDVEDPGFDIMTGTGRINAERALESLQDPYELFHWTAEGPSRYSLEDDYLALFYDEPPLSSHTWWHVFRYRVERDIVFTREFWEIPSVWRRGVAMQNGGYPSSNVLYGGMGWCEPVEGSVTTTGCTLVTYVYDVYDLGGHGKGWFPCHPDDVMFAYSVHGEPGPEQWVTVPGLGELARGPFIELSTPNPSPGEVRIEAVVPRKTQACLLVINAAGRVVRELWQGVLEPGERSFVWDSRSAAGERVASGVYFLRLETASGTVQQKLVVVR